MKNRKLWVSIIAGFLALVMILGFVVSVIPTPVSAESSASIKKRIEEMEKEKKEISEAERIAKQIEERFHMKVDIK